MAQEHDRLAGTLLGRAKTPEDIEFEKERAERDAALTRDVQERRAHLEEIRAFMFKWSEWALNSKSVNQEEKDRLQKERAHIDETLQRLDKLLNISPLARQADILYLAGDLLWRGVSLGQFLPPSKAVMRHHQDQAVTARMREAKAAKKPEDRALEQAVFDRIYGKSIDKPSWTFARNILGPVNKDLARQGYKPVDQNKIYKRINSLMDFLRSLQESGKSEPPS